MLQFLLDEYAGDIHISSGMSTLDEIEEKEILDIKAEQRDKLKDRNNTTPIAS